MLSPREDVTPGRDHSGPSGTPWIMDCFCVAESMKKCDGEMLSGKNNRMAMFVSVFVCCTNTSMVNGKTEVARQAVRCG